MPAQGPRAMDGELLASRYGALPPVMQDYSARLAGLAAPPASPLRLQARSAWTTLQYLGSLSGHGNRE
jgi:hypothetical protein